MWLHDVPPGNSRYWDRNLSFEEFFSGEVGRVKELWASEPWGMDEKQPQKTNLAMGVVELPKLKTREEMERRMLGFPTDFGPKELPLYIRLMKKKRRFLIGGIRNEKEYIKVHRSNTIDLAVLQFLLCPKCRDS